MADPVVSWMGSRNRLAGLLLAGLVSSLAVAEPVSVTGTLSARHSDNIGKTEQKDSDTETSAQLSIRHVSDPGQCESELSASVGYTSWLNDFYDPESTVESGFDGSCELRPGLDWRMRNSLTEVLASSRQNDTPDNRSRRNFFSTGPVLTIPLTSVDQISASVSFENTQYEEPAVADSKRYLGSLGWNHLFSPTLSGGISGSFSQQELNSDVETDSTSLNLNVSNIWAATSLNASLGFTRRESQFRSSEQSSDGVVGSVTLTREVNPTTSLYVSASRQLTDQASDFTLEFEDVNFDFTEEVGVEVTAVELGLDKTFSDGTVAGVQVYGNQSDYLQTSERENIAGLRFSVNRSIRPHLSFRSNVNYEYLRYESNLQDDQRVIATVGLSYSLTADLDCTATIGHSLRESDLQSSEFDESWALFSLSYRFL
ncbi:outer membrane beta-barrel protein [Marinobacter sp. CHS3-4]|uniref:outer membrane beta-barrel protein n=1 Tax=Marinobacter sp. CHS3-4 TaxID=3045174 RepID=UPI0024B517DE|nr:outer membrane beta-barrel protein [Marinobacter sp. CHS3-4]MDI9245590.1 outer membrane beta-barrel protein [Marinobacter sp. CHS3-4]